MNSEKGTNSKSELPLNDRDSLQWLVEGLRHVQDLSLPQVTALLRIAVEPGLSVNELADRIGLPQQTTSRHVATLLGRYQDAADFGSGDRGKADPLIVQQISEVDPRRRALFLSEAGRSLVKKILSKPSTKYRRKNT